MKYLFVVILEKNEYAPTLFKKFQKNGMNGTIIPTGSLKDALMSSNDEPVPTFIGFRRMTDDNMANNTMLFVIVDEENLAVCKEIVNETTTELKDRAGIMFALPVTFVEGLDK